MKKYKPFGKKGLRTSSAITELLDPDFVPRDFTADSAEDDSEGEGAFDVDVMKIEEMVGNSKRRLRTKLRKL